MTKASEYAIILLVERINELEDEVARLKAELSVKEIENEPDKI